MTIDDWENEGGFVYSQEEMPELGDIAIVTTSKGRKFVAVYTSAAPIDHFWNPVIKDDRLESVFRDPEVSFKIIGRVL